MRIFTPHDVAVPTGSKYLGVLVAAKFARFLNEFPGESEASEKKLTTRALEKLTNDDIRYVIVTED